MRNIRLPIMHPLHIAACHFCSLFNCQNPGIPEHCTLPRPILKGCLPDHAIPSLGPSSSLVLRFSRDPPTRVIGFNMCMQVGITTCRVVGRYRDPWSAWAAYLLMLLHCITSKLPGQGCVIVVRSVSAFNAGDTCDPCSTFNDNPHLPQRPCRPHFYYRSCAVKERWVLVAHKSTAGLGD